MESDKNIDVLDTKTNLLSFGITDAAMADLRDRFSKVTAISCKQDYEFVRKGIRQIVGLRTGVDKKRKDLNADDQARISGRNAEAKRVTAELRAIENPLVKLKMDEDQRVEAEKQKKIDAENNRVGAIRDKLRRFDLSTFGVHGGGIGSGEIRAMLDGLVGIEITPEEFQEFADEALEDKEKAIEFLTREHDIKLKLEAEAEERRVEAERLAAERAELEKERQALQDRLDAESKEREARERKERKAEEERQKELQAKKEEAERVAEEKAEAERLEALKPDLEKLNDAGIRIRDYAADLITHIPDFENSSVRLLYRQAVVQIRDAGASLCVEEE